MAKASLMKFRVSVEQRDKITNEARKRGYYYTANYLRDMALQNNITIENKIIETNIVVKRILESLKNGTKQE